MVVVVHSPRSAISFFRSFSRVRVVFCFLHTPTQQRDTQRCVMCHRRVRVCCYPDNHDGPRGVYRAGVLRFGYRYGAACGVFLFSSRPFVVLSFAHDRVAENHDRQPVASPRGSNRSDIIYFFFLFLLLSLAISSSRHPHKSHNSRRFMRACIIEHIVCVTYADRTSGPSPRHGRPRFNSGPPS